MMVYGYDSEDDKPLKMSDAALAHYIDLGTETGTAEADVMGGIILALHMLCSQFPKGKVDRRILVLSDLTEPMNMDGMDAILEKILELEVAFTVVTFDAPESSVRVRDCISHNHRLKIWKFSSKSLIKYRDNVLMMNSLWTRSLNRVQRL